MSSSDNDGTGWHCHRHPCASLEYSSAFFASEDYAPRAINEAAQLTITYDHQGKRAKLHSSPNPEV
ncbi:MAG: hypothetical protein GY745_00025 [Actinomycetia bacterium]|nr:hypothetical protein [Actinomycetes bacterium]MCP4083433.1 hypothetical protein [Actinomycetes bacterium]